MFPPRFVSRDFIYQREKAEQGTCTSCLAYLPLLILGISKYTEGKCTPDMDYRGKANCNCHILPWVIVTDRFGSQTQLREISSAFWRSIYIWKRWLNPSPTPRYLLWQWLAQLYTIMPDTIIFDPTSSALFKTFPLKQPMSARDGRNLESSGSWDVRFLMSWNHFLELHDLKYRVEESFLPRTMNTSDDPEQALMTRIRHENRRAVEDRSVARNSSL